MNRLGPWALLGALLVGHAGRAQQLGPNGVIAGRVVDSVSGQPIAGARVTLRTIGRTDVTIDSTGKPVALPGPGTTTDADGRFMFRSVWSGSHQILATVGTGFVDSSAQVDLADGQQADDVEIRMPKWGSLAGTVSDDAGDPVVGMRVDIHIKKMAAFRPMLMPRGSVKTDDRGRYYIGSLPPGEYVICACGWEPLTIDKAFLALLGPLPPTASALSRRLNASVPTFPPTFHPGATRALDSDTVVLKASDDRQGIDIIVRAVTPRRVSGQLVGITLDPTGLTMILIRESDSPDAQALSAIAPAHVTPNGGFEFVGVPPGRYSLEAFPSGKQDRWASISLMVDDEDVNGLVVPLSAGTPVTGRLEFSGGSTRPDATELMRARVSLVPAELTPRMMIATGASGSTGFSGTASADGTFRIDGVPPGRYMMTAGALGPTWQLLHSVRSGPDGAADRFVTVGPQGLTDVVVTMSDTVSAMVVGTVALAKYESPQSVRVVLFPAEPSTWSEPMRFPERFRMTSITDRTLVRTATTPAQVVTDRNTFRLLTVPPGEYFVTTVESDTYIGADQFAELSRSAIRLSLQEGQTATVELKRQGP
jgi:protocatechuate 3,4-dioxygenase beta subunit